MASTGASHPFMFLVLTGQVPHSWRRGRGCCASRRRRRRRFPYREHGALHHTVVADYPRWLGRRWGAVSAQLQRSWP